MQPQDTDVLRHALNWCKEGANPWLCTVTKAVGSSPRPVGSMLALHSDGQQSGSVSGGCVEDDLLEKLRSNTLDTTRPQRITYGVSASENERLGLPCGGHLHLLLQRLNEEDINWLTQLVATLESRHCITRTLDLHTGKSQVQEVESFSALTMSDSHLHQCYGPRTRMLLIGAGQLSRSLAELALAMDYDVIVTDPRADMLAQWEGPELTLLQGMPDDIVREYASDRHSIVITLTHDPRIDDMALMEALTTDARYVGALGSKKTTEKRLQRLQQLGVNDQQIAKLHAPVGLSIGSKTPIEIAVSIMAQLIQLK